MSKKLAYLGIGAAVSVAFFYFYDVSITFSAVKKES